MLVWFADKCQFLWFLFNNICSSKANHLKCTYPIFLITIHRSCFGYFIFYGSWCHMVFWNPETLTFHRVICLVGPRVHVILTQIFLIDYTCLSRFYINYMIIWHVFQPERIRGEEYSNPAEVWSFGITLFEVAFLSNQWCKHALLECGRSWIQVSIRSSQRL